MIQINCREADGSLNRENHAPYCHLSATLRKITLNVSFADSLLCVLAQRLVRSLCTACKESYHPAEDEFQELARHYGERAFSLLNIACDEKLTLYRPKGCPACNGTGYRGMMGIFELLTATDNIKQMIISRNSMAAIRKTAAGEGMKTLLQGGILKVLRGETDLIEVLSICMR